MQLLWSQSEIMMVKGVLTDWQPQNSYIHAFVPSALTVECFQSAVPGRMNIDCTASNVVTAVCSFDGGPPEPCTFPLQLGFLQFGFIPHTLNVTFTDSFSNTVHRFFDFIIARSEKHNFLVTLYFNLTLSFTALDQPAISITFSPTVSVEEGALNFLLTFRVTGFTLETFRFSLVPLSYQEFETITRQSVETIFGSSIPEPAGIGKKCVLCARYYRFHNGALFVLARYWYCILRFNHMHISLQETSCPLGG